DLRMIPKPLQWVFSRFHRFTVTALLPQHLRDEMGMEWTDRQERRFRRTVGLISAVATRLPTPLRLFPLNFYLFDMRVRRRLGTKLV
ncbi:MAG: DUF2236 domain-containing protein, partial [Nocardia sp.]|nr:DUF2236 domain-containing protein [Nocardia sp.]